MLQLTRVVRLLLRLIIRVVGCGGARGHGIILVGGIMVSYRLSPLLLLVVLVVVVCLLMGLVRMRVGERSLLLLLSAVLLLLLLVVSRVLIIHSYTS